MSITSYLFLHFQSFENFGHRKENAYCPMISFFKGFFLLKNWLNIATQIFHEQLWSDLSRQSCLYFQNLYKYIKIYYIYIYIYIYKILLFCDLRLFKSPYRRSIFATAVSFNWEILGSIRLRSFTRDKQKRSYGSAKYSKKLFQARGCKNIADSKYHENCGRIYIHENWENQVSV